MESASLEGTAPSMSRRRKKGLSPPDSPLLLQYYRPRTSILWRWLPSQRHRNRSPAFSPCLLHHGVLDHQIVVPIASARSFLIWLDFRYRSRVRVVQCKVQVHAAALLHADMIAERWEWPGDVRSGSRSVKVVGCTCAWLDWKINIFLWPPSRAVYRAWSTSSSSWLPCTSWKVYLLQYRLWSMMVTVWVPRLVQMAATCDQCSIATKYSRLSLMLKTLKNFLQDAKSKL